MADQERFFKLQPSIVPEGEAGVKFHSGFWSSEQAGVSPSRYSVDLGNTDQAAFEEGPHEVRLRILLHATVLAPPKFLKRDEFDAVRDLPPYNKPLDATTKTATGEGEPTSMGLRPLLLTNQRFTTFICAVLLMCYGPPGEYLDHAQGVVVHNILTWCISSLKSQRRLLLQGTNGSHRDNSGQGSHKGAPYPTQRLPAVLQHPYLQHTNSSSPTPSSASGTATEPLASEMPFTSQIYQSLPFARRLQHIRDITMMSNKSGVALFDTKHGEDLEVLSLAYVDLVVPKSSPMARWLWIQDGVDWIRPRRGAVDPESHAATWTVYPPTRHSLETVEGIRPPEQPPQWTRLSHSAASPRLAAHKAAPQKVGPSQPDEAVGIAVEANTADGSFPPALAIAANSVEQTTAVNDINVQAASGLVAIPESSEQGVDATQTTAKAQSPPKSFPQITGQRKPKRLTQAQREYFMGVYRLALPVPQSPRRTAICTTPAWHKYLGPSADSAGAQPVASLAFSSTGHGEQLSQSAMTRLLLLQEHDLTLAIFYDILIVLEGDAESHGLDTRTDNEDGAEDWEHWQATVTWSPVDEHQLKDSLASPSSSQPIKDSAKTQASATSSSESSGGETPKRASPPPRVDFIVKETNAGTLGKSKSRRSPSLSSLALSKMSSLRSRVPSEEAPRVPEERVARDASSQRSKGHGAMHNIKKRISTVFGSGNKGLATA